MTACILVNLQASVQEQCDQVIGISFMPRSIIPSPSSRISSHTDDFITQGEIEEKGWNNPRSAIRLPTFYFWLRSPALSVPDGSFEAGYRDCNVQGE